MFSPRHVRSLSAVLPSFRSASPFPQILRSAAASSTSSLSSLFQLTPTDTEIISLPSDEGRAHQATIAQAFGPTVAVVASRECEEMLRGKGYSSFLELLRPFGDCIQGTVNIRDSQAMSIPVDDFTVKFVDFHQYSQGVANGKEKAQGPYAPKPISTQHYIPGGDLIALERLMDQRIESLNESHEKEKTNGGKMERGNEYSYFLKRMLSAIPVSAHETFSHPVACILAVSSRHPEPIDALLGLYNTTNNAPIPRFIDAGFLRYYVLIHDEDNDNIDKSMAILDKMKRSLGLHCTILRLNTTTTDKDTIPLSKPAWISASEELASLENPVQSQTLSILDRNNLQRFAREMVTQSIVPHMERCISTWNDQIASYRRGLAGRVFTVSRRFFGSTTSRSSTPTTGSGNFDITSSSYPPSTPEAQMRKLADYAFMLRDWKLANSTYDIVRKDFANDKAWKYAAGAQEMTAITLLLLPTPLSQSKRTEILDPLIDSAIYSYTARSSSPYFSLRTTLICIELLTSKGGTAPDDAVKWATKTLSSATLGDIGNCLLIERIATCYKVMHPRRRRKMALWSVLACENWMGVGCKVLAIRCLRDALSIYKDSEFGRIGGHLAGLMESLGWRKGGEKGMEVVDMQHDVGQEEITVEFA